MQVQFTLTAPGETPSRQTISRTTRIGRDPDCELVLEDTDNNASVSSVHAQLVLAADGVYLEDLDSSNGTFLNGRRLATRTRLQEGDRFTLGKLGPSVAIDSIRVSSAPAAAPRSQPRNQQHASPALPSAPLVKRIWLPVLIGTGCLGLGVLAVVLMLSGAGDETTPEPTPSGSSPPEPVPRLVASKQLLRTIQTDLSSAPAIDRPYYRYFACPASRNASSTTAPPEPELAPTALARLINSLSWKEEIVLPQPVDEQQTIYRIDLRKLGWADHQVWERLVAANPYALSWQEHPDEELRELARSVSQLAGTEVPFVRADWFVSTASRSPLYEQILQLPPDVQSLEGRLQVNVQRDFELNRLQRAGVTQHGVSRGGRIVDRHPARYGAYWKTYELATATPQGDSTRFPLGPAFSGHPFSQYVFQHHGGAAVFHLPNGLTGYYLFDESGQYVPSDSVKLFQDAGEISGAASVVNGLSCIQFHRQGVMQLTDTVRNGHTLTGEARLKVRELYPDQSRLNRLLEDDRQRFLTALSRTSSPSRETTPDSRPPEVEQPVEPIGRLVRTYQRDLTLETAAAELGLTDPAELRELIRNTPRLQEVGLNLLVEGNTIPRSVWTARGPNAGATVFQLVASASDLGTAVSFPAIPPPAPGSP